MTYHLSTYYNCAYEQENQQTNDNVLDAVLTMTVCLNYEVKMLRINLKALYKYTDKFLTILHCWITFGLCCPVLSEVKSAIYPVEILQISKSFSIKPAAGIH